MNILLIEDNPDLATNIFDYLESHGHVLDLASDGITGLHLAVTNLYEVVILDVMLPGMDGMQVCRKLREAGKHVPVLMLTAMDSLDDKIAGLAAGADDYVVKPFSLREVDARLQALIRRAQIRDSKKLLHVADVTLNADTMQVQRSERMLALPPIPYKMLEILMRNTPRVIPRNEMEQLLWGDTPPDSDALRAHLYILRSEVDKEGEKPLIKTKRGLGYQISDE